MIHFFNCGYIFTLILFSYAISNAQQIETPIVKITYASSPISQYNMSKDDMMESSSKASVYSLMQGITDYYSLYINLEDRSSLYVLDSTEQKKVRGWEISSTTASPVDTVLFSIKTPKEKTFKHEWIMNQTFFTEGKVGDLKWELTDEEKNISGLKCYRAISKNYPMLSVWYTKEIPVSNGPGIYQGLPGLIVSVEDFFRTIQLIEVEYIKSVETFKKLYNIKKAFFSEKKENGKNFSEEPILILKKGDLARSLYEYTHGKSYRKN